MKKGVFVSIFVLIVSFFSFCISAMAMAEYEQIAVGETKTITIGDKITFSFTPEYDAEYAFSSEDTNGTFTGYLYDSSMNLMTSNWGGSSGFCIEWRLKAGEKYYWAVNGHGSVTVYLNISSITTWEVKDNVLTISGYGKMEDYSYSESHPWPNTIEQAIISSGITSIGNYAFSNCDCLISVGIPDSITYIGDDAFTGCGRLTQIVLPDNISNISRYAFYGSNAKRIAKQNTLTAKALGERGNSFRIQGTSFDLWEGQLEIRLERADPDITTLVIPDFVTIIAHRAFQNCTLLSSVTIPSSVIKIRDYAFENCSSLVNIQIPDTIKELGSGLFHNCSSLTSIRIPDGIKVSSYDSMFDGCEKLESVILPSGMTEIPKQTFQNCKKLKSIEIPATVTSIGEYAFDGCSSLQTLELPEQLSGIGQYAFKGCGFESIIIPEGITGIENGTFMGCDKLEQIDLPGELKSIGDYAFARCVKLQEIIFPEKIVKIGKEAFSTCSSIRKVDLPDSILILGEGAFSQCDDLIEADLPENMNEIPNGLFYYCRKLIALGIPESITVVGKSAFDYCDSLKSIVLPYGLKSINEDAFSCCSNLERISLPDSVESIAKEAFYGCVNLKSVLIPTGTLTLGESVFKNCENLEEIYFMGRDTIVGEFAVSTSPDVYCYHNSTPEAWALDQQLTIQYLDDLDDDNRLKIDMPSAMDIPFGRNSQAVYEIFHMIPITEMNWQSSNENIVKVDAKGIMTPVKIGTADITLTVNGESAKTAVTVRPLADDINVDGGVIYAITGEQTIISFLINPHSALTSLSVESDNTNYYDVYTDTYTGTIRYIIDAHVVGRSSVTVFDKYSGIKTTIPVQIGRVRNEVSLEQQELRLMVGERAKIRATVIMGQYQFENQTLNWRKKYDSPQYEAVALNQDSGEIIGISPGTVYIEVRDHNGNSFGSCIVTVEERIPQRLPNGLREIGQEAFLGINASYIILPNGLEKIGEKAFAEARVASLMIRIPSSVETIAENAFFGCDEVIILGESGSCAEDHANAHDNISFVQEE